ncbi:MAG: hypothetical protein KDL10_07315, partial [Kiritimatiellae bacterium]|nr:hypothetical protein [Kiritimatiellia bacterium]
GVTLGQTEQSFDDLFSDLDSLLPQDAPATVTASEAPAEEVWADLDTIANGEETAADANAESASEPEVASEPQMTDAAEVEEPAPAPVLVEEPETEVVEQAKLLAEQEEVRRQAQEQAGLQQYTDGLAAMDRGDYAKAIELLEQARENLGVRPGNDARVAEAGAMLVDAYVETAKAEVKASPDQASEAIQKALAIDPANRKAQSMEKRVAAAQRWSEKQAAQKPQPAQMPKYKSKADEIASLIKEGRALFELGEYNDAEAIFDKALSVDEYNVDAMRFLRKIGEIRYDRRTTEREATVADMIQDVRNAWNPATRGDIVSPETITGEGPVPTDTPAQRLQRKMESIRIRAIEFRQANIQDVVQLLVRESIAADPEGNGVNIILNLKLPGGSDTTATPAPATDDPFGFGGGGGFDDFGFPTDSAVST